MKLQVKNKRIKKFYDNEIKVMGDWCLCSVKSSIKLSAPKLIEAGIGCHRIVQETVENNTR